MTIGREDRAALIELGSATLDAQHRRRPADGGSGDGDAAPAVAAVTGADVLGVLAAEPERTRSWAATSRSCLRRSGFVRRRMASVDDTIPKGYGSVTYAARGPGGPP